MAYSLETSSVKTIVPGAEVSGFADVVARAKTNELGSSATMLSGAIDYVSARVGSVSSYPYIVSARTLGSPASSFVSNPVLIFSGAGSWPGLSQYAVKINLSSENENYQCGWLAPAGTSQQGNSDIFLGWSTTWKAPSWQKLDVYQKTETSSKQEISAALQDAHIDELSSYYKKTETSSKEELADAFENAGHTYTGIDPIQVDNINSTIGITGESLSAGPGIDMFSSGGYVVISANGSGGSTFPMTATDGSRNYQMDINSSAMCITTATGAAGATTKLTTPGIQYEAYPATDMSASWRNVINAANNRSNCYCVTLNSNNTAVDLEDLSAYDRITVLHAQEYINDDYYIRWNNNTKTVHSGEYIEMAKVKYNGNPVWTFITTGWYDDALWD